MLWAGISLAVIPSQLAGQIVMEGPFSYSQDGTSLNLQAARIINRGTVGSFTGTLRMQLLAKSSFYTGSALTGHELGSVTFGQLRNGGAHAPVDRSVTYKPPLVEGRYNIVLSEFRGVAGGSYQPVDWYNFGEVEVGPGRTDGFGATCCSDYYTDRQSVYQADKFHLAGHCERQCWTALTGIPGPVA
jgi:hypothetical protein